MKLLALLAFGLSTAMFAHGGSHGGTNVIKEKAADKVQDGREIELQFTSQVHGDLQVVMTPLTPKLKVKIGERYKVEYRFQNKTGKDIPVLAVHSVFPTSEGASFKKYVCFCFESQTLEKGADITLPIEFRVTKDLAKEHKVVRIDYKLYEKKAPLKRKPLKSLKHHSKKKVLNKRKASIQPLRWNLGLYGVTRPDGSVLPKSTSRV